MQSLFDLQQIEKGELSRLVATFMRALGAEWINNGQRAAIWPPNGTFPTPSQVIDTIQSVYTIERMGMCHDERVNLVEFFCQSPPAYGPTVREQTD